MYVYLSRSYGSLYSPTIPKVKKEEKMKKKRYLGLKTEHKIIYLPFSSITEFQDLSAFSYFFE